jgi:hypothetical protein
MSLQAVDVGQLPAVSDVECDQRREVGEKV